MTKTMTAEEVNEAVEEIRSQMEIAFDITGTSEAALSALSRLAAQAARVPGLEDRLNAMRDSRDRAEQATENQRQRANQAESERDAARKERDEKLTLQAAQRDSALREVNTLRERVATLAAEVEKWKEAARAVNDLHDTAEARVRELEAALRSFHDVACNIPTEHDDARLDKAIAAARVVLNGPASQPPPAPAQGVDARESLRAWVRASGKTQKDVATLLNCHESALSFILSGKNNPGDSLAADIERLTNGRVPAASWPARMDFRGNRRAAEGVARRASPTPPPGLREAVDPVLQHLEGLTLTNGALVSNIERLRAAYDATGGEGPRATVAQVDSLVRDAIAAHDAALGSDAEDAAKYRAGVERLDDRAGQAKAAHDAWGSDPEGAVARWVLYGDGAAPAPRATLDKDRVVEALRSEWNVGDRDTQQALERVATLLDVDRDLDTPPSGPGGGEKMLEWSDLSNEPRPEPHTTCTSDECGDGEPDACPTFGRTTTPALEVPPLVESPPDTSSVGAEYSQGFGDGWTKRGARMRLAMSSRDVAMRRLLGAVGKLVSVYSEISGESPAETAASFEPTPEVPPLKPSTPAVVMDDPDVRVFADGTVILLRPSPLEPLAPSRASEHILAPVLERVARALAEAKTDARLARASLSASEEALRQTDKALAEAKREAAEMRKAHEAVQHAAENEAWATAGGDVIAIHSVRLERDTADTAKQAAESMRERAKAVILKQLAEEEEDGLSSDDRGYSALMLRRLAGEVGKIPQE